MEAGKELRGGGRKEKLIKEISNFRRSIFSVINR